MHTIEFYYMPESPPCRLVEMVAELAGVKLKKFHLNLAQKEHLKEEFVKLNPRHKVPFIVDGNVKIGESRAIACYLVNKYMPADNTLYPADPVRRAYIDELLFIDAASLYTTGSALFYPIILGATNELNPEAEKNYLDNIEMLDKRLERGGKKFFTGDNLTIGDVAIATSFQITYALDYDISKFKNIKQFWEHVKAEVPKYTEINKGPMENMRNYVRSKAFSSE